MLPTIYEKSCVSLPLAMVSMLTQQKCLVMGIDHDTVCAVVVGTAIQQDCSTNHDSADRISSQFRFYHNHNFTKSKGNLRFRRLVPLFVLIGVCVTTHDDGTASDVTIGK